MEYNLNINQETRHLEVDITGETTLNVDLEEVRHPVAYNLVSEYQIQLDINGKIVNAFICEAPSGKTIVINGISYQVQDADLAAQQTKKKGVNSRIPTEVTPQTPSVVVSVLAKKGDVVKKGQGVVVLSAMKMETTLNAPFAGTVIAVNTKEGDKVAPGDILVDIEKDTSAEESES
jgi:biotin carboxyl carrier protein